MCMTCSIRLCMTQKIAHAKSAILEDPKASSHVWCKRRHITCACMCHRSMHWKHGSTSSGTFTHLYMASDKSTSVAIDDFDSNFYLGHFHCSLCLRPGCPYGEGKGAGKILVRNQQDLFLLESQARVLAMVNGRGGCANDESHVWRTVFLFHLFVTSSP